MSLGFRLGFREKGLRTMREVVAKGLQRLIAIRGSSQSLRRYLTCCHGAWADFASSERLRFL